MRFSLKSYQVFKLKNHFKNQSLLIGFHCSKLNLKEWITIEQKLKKLQLNYYKPLNKVTLKEFKNSRYLNYSFFINGSILFLNFYKNLLSNVTLQQIEKSLKPLFLPIIVKLNNNLYFSKQFVKLKKLPYKDNVLILHKTFTKSCKTSYVLSQFKKSKQCDLNT